jgi:hypothetical protein
LPVIQLCDVEQDLMDAIREVDRNLLGWSVHDRVTELGLCDVECSFNPNEAVDDS